jgi:hypothetical protein
MHEFIPEKYQNVATTLYMILLASFHPLGAFYFQKISINSDWYLFFIFSGNVLGFLLSFVYLPESPKFYIMNQSYRKARKILSTISRLNDKGDEPFYFQKDEFKVFSNGSVVQGALTLLGEGGVSDQQMNKFIEKISYLAGMSDRDIV